MLTFRAGYNTAVCWSASRLLGVAAGVVGTFALLRKRALMSDALSHATLPGIAIAFLVAVALGHGRAQPAGAAGRCAVLRRPRRADGPVRSSATPACR